MCTGVVREGLDALMAVAFPFGDGANRVLLMGLQGQFSLYTLDGCLHALHLSCLSSNGLCILQMKLIMHAEDAGDIIDIGVWICIFFLITERVIAV